MLSVVLYYSLIKAHVLRAECTSTTLRQAALSVSTTQNEKLQVHFIYGESNFIAVLEHMERKRL